MDLGRDRSAPDVRLRHAATLKEATLHPFSCLCGHRLVRGDINLLAAQRPAICTARHALLKGQFAGLLGPQWDPWFLEASAWCHHGWGACPRCYDGRPGLQDGRTYDDHPHPLFRAPNLVLPQDVSPARLRDRCERLAFESSALLLRPYLQELTDRIWRQEGCAGQPPEIETLGVADENGNASFRPNNAQVLDCRQYSRASGPRRMKPIGKVNTIRAILAQFFFWTSFV